VELFTDTSIASFRSANNSRGVRPRQTGIQLLNRTNSTDFLTLDNVGLLTFSIVSATINEQSVRFFGRTFDSSASGFLSKMALTGWGDALPNPAAWKTAIDKLMANLGVVV
jgi:hypothetical protein